MNSVREAFLDDGVDEQILLDLKRTWETKLNESKAIDYNAKEPEPVPVTKQSNRSNNSVAGSSHSSRNSQLNKEHTAQQQQQQSQPSQAPHVNAPTVTSNSNHQLGVNHISGSSGGQQNMPHLHLQPGTNIVLGPSGINYTTSSNDSVRH